MAVARPGLSVKASSAARQRRFRRLVRTPDSSSSISGENARALARSDRPQMNESSDCIRIRVVDFLPSYPQHWKGRPDPSPAGRKVILETVWLGKKAKSPSVGRIQVTLLHSLRRIRKRTTSERASERWPPIDRTLCNASRVQIRFKWGSDKL